MNKIFSLIIAIVYLLLALTTLSIIGCKLIMHPELFLADYRVWVGCIIIAGFGGCLYCLRGVYLNFCVRKSWDNDWIVWYFLRPITSLISGGVSYLFLKAGLLVLDAKKQTDASNLGFYALAFIAGLNVDKFISKIEDLAKTLWGIEKSRAGSSTSQENSSTTNSTSQQQVSSGDTNPNP